MSNPLFALSLFFHISATVVWIGGLTVTLLLVWPEVNRILQQSPEMHRLLSRLRKRFYPVSNLALGVLIVTGLFQMTADPNYDGLLQFENLWSQVMLAKHLTIVVMAMVGLGLQYGVIPSLERVSLLREQGKGDTTAWERLRKREIRLTVLSVILGIVIIALSVWASVL